MIDERRCGYTQKALHLPHNTLKAEGHHSYMMGHSAYPALAQVQYVDVRRRVDVDKPVHDLGNHYGGQVDSEGGIRFVALAEALQPYTDLDMGVIVLLCAVRAMPQNVGGLPTLQVTVMGRSETLLMDWSLNGDLMWCW